MCCCVCVTMCCLLFNTLACPLWKNGVWKGRLKQENECVGAPAMKRARLLDTKKASGATILPLLRQIKAVAWSDGYCHLNDRVDAQPQSLPPIDREVRVTIVRHGQSTWNAEKRLQGSDNTSVLTQKGLEQARTTQRMVGWMGWGGEAASELTTLHLQGSRNEICTRQSNSFPPCRSFKVCRFSAFT